MSTRRKVLRRYTDIPSAIDIVRSRAITLLSPTTWDDRNDRYMMATYKRVTRLKTLLALCFSQVGETYHHWRVFTPGSAGVCIEFYRDELIEQVDRVPSISYAPVDYLLIEELDAAKIAVKDLPFIKRTGFSDEQEFRIVYTSARTDLPTKSVPVKIETIRRVVLNPWLPEVLAEGLCEMFQLVAGEAPIEVTHSALIDSPSWRDFADDFDQSKK